MIRLEKTNEITKKVWICYFLDADLDEPVVQICTDDKIAINRWGTITVQYGLATEEQIVEKMLAMDEIAREILA